MSFLTDLFQRLQAAKGLPHTAQPPMGRMLPGLAGLGSAMGAMQHTPPAAPPAMAGAPPPMGMPEPSPQPPLQVDKINPSGVPDSTMDTDAPSGAMGNPGMDLGAMGEQGGFAGPAAGGNGDAGAMAGQLAAMGENPQKAPKQNPSPQEMAANAADYNKNKGQMALRMGGGNMLRM